MKNINYRNCSEIRNILRVNSEHSTEFKEFKLKNHYVGLKFGCYFKEFDIVKMIPKMLDIFTVY